MNTPTADWRALAAYRRRAARNARIWQVITMLMAVSTFFGLGSVWLGFTEPHGAWAITFGATVVCAAVWLRYWLRSTS